MRSLLLPLLTTLALGVASPSHASPACDKAFENVASIIVQSKAAQMQDIAQIMRGDADKNPDFAANISGRIENETASMVAEYRSGCQPGEIVRVEWDSIVQQVCDFEKPIIRIWSPNTCIMRQLPP